MSILLLVCYILHEKIHLPDPVELKRSWIVLIHNAWPTACIWGGGWENPFQLFSLPILIHQILRLRIHNEISESGLEYENRNLSRLLKDTQNMRSWQPPVWPAALHPVTSGYPLQLSPKTWSSLGGSRSRARVSPVQTVCLYQSKMHVLHVWTMLMHWIESSDSDWRNGTTMTRSCYLLQNLVEATSATTSFCVLHFRCFPIFFGIHCGPRQSPRKRHFNLVLFLE